MHYYFLVFLQLKKDWYCHFHQFCEDLAHAETSQAGSNLNLSESASVPSSCARLSALLPSALLPNRSKRTFALLGMLVAQNQAQQILYTCCRDDPPQKCEVNDLVWRNIADFWFQSQPGSHSVSCESCFIVGSLSIALELTSAKRLKLRAEMRTWSSLLITLWSMPSYMSERELFVMNLWGWVTASWDSVDGNRMTCVKLLWGRSESPFTMREDGHLTRKG